MNRFRFAVATALIITSTPLAARNPCPSSDVNSVARDPVVQRALDDAWRDSHEGQPDEHEEGGWIYQCQSTGSDGTVQYETRVIRWPPGQVAAASPTPPTMDAGCRLVSSFHTHPGGRRSDNNGDGFSNNKPSVADYEFARQHGIPGIIVWGTGDNTHIRTYGEKETTEPSNPAWVCPGEGARPAAGWGEPHLRTFDNFTYDFQAIGDFTLAQSTDGDLDIQVRHQPFHDSTSVSVTTGFAIRDGEDRVEWAGGVFDPIVNGRPRPMTQTEVVRLRSWAEVRRTDDGFAMVTGRGDRITVNVGNEYLDYVIHLAPARRNKMRGLLGGFDGDPDNDLQTSAGRVLTSPPVDAVDRTHALYTMFAASWRVDAGKSLFAAPFASPIDAATFPQKFAAPVVPDDDAIAKCTATGVTDEAVRKACAFDIAATRNDAFLASARRANRNADTPSTPEGTVLVDREVIGVIRSADQRASFDLQLARGAYVIDGRGSHDTAWTFTGADGSQLLDANQSVYMGQYPTRVIIDTPGRYRVSIGARPQTTRGQFRFRVRTVPVVPTRVIQVGADVSGRIAALGEQHEYTIVLGAGTYDMRAAVAEDTAWSLRAPDGQAVLDANQEEFMEPVSGLVLKTPGRYTLVIHGRGTIGLGAYAVKISAR